ncbi:hypothetical protein G6011_06879 [Alternaria panax]|uniref:Uncharacterized protein n=1 Tax=Alternaria panax TaxID=48097 RepID=A0AAD4I4K8_9PLEO|nr:hypothetical protein G6011_06879 [Alternaria panax]
MKTDTPFFDEDKAFLSERNDDEVPISPTRQTQWTRIHLLGLYFLIAVQAVVLLWSDYRVPRDPSQLIYSPAADAVEYQIVDFGKYFLRRNEYMGERGQLPTDEVDALWNDLYDGKFFFSFSIRLRSA